MLTPFDVQNKTFKGGIGYDKKEVENFIRDVASDYESLYRSNVELKDKVTTLNESLQHYRSIEDSMQKALTLSEKTAEETINAANDKGRQVTTEAEKKAESILEDAKKELAETKNEIYKLQQQYAKFKKQYTKILYMQLKGLGEEVIDIDLGEDFEADITYEESSLNDGLGGLGTGGGYTGSSSLDDRFERTNQEPAFGNMGSLNMDPFVDAMNGGGRFSKKSSKTFSGNSNKKKSVNFTNSTVKSQEDKKSVKPVKDVTVSAAIKPEQDMSATTFVEQNVISDTSVTTPVEQNVTSDMSSATPVGPNVTSDMGAATPVEPNVTSDMSATISVEPSITSDVSGIVSGKQKAVSDSNEEKVVSGEVEESINKSNMLGNNDDAEGFNFIQDVEEIKKNVESTETQTEPAKEKIVSFEKKAEPMVEKERSSEKKLEFAKEKTVSSESKLHFVTEKTESATGSDCAEEVIAGEVEDRVNEATMLDSQDNHDEGFDFMGNEPVEVAPSGLDTTELDEDTYVGEVEDRVNESTMLESEDDMSEGFNFLVGNEEEEDDIPTIFPNLHTINVTAAAGTWEGAIEEETAEEEEEEIKFV